MLLKFARSCCILLSLIIFFSVNAEEELFDKMVEDLIHEKLQDPSTAVELNFESKAKLEQLRKLQHLIEFAELTYFDANNSTFRAKIKINDGRNFEIYGRFSLALEVPVAARTIKPGEIISQNDIVTVRTKISRIRDGYVTSAEQIVGFQAKKAFSPGMLVKISDLIKPAVIKINDPVNIIYTTNNIKLKTTGIAMSAGAIGDTIKVRNENTGVVVLGQIINKNTVQIGAE